MVSARTKTNIRFNGREYANADEMPVDVRAAYDRAVDEMPPLHSGARLAAKLQAKIIVNGNEFNHPGEMSVEDRHSYHEALEALFSPDITVTPTHTRETTGKKVSVLGAVRNYFSRTLRVFKWRR